MPGWAASPAFAAGSVPAKPSRPGVRIRPGLSVFMRTPPSGARTRAGHAGTAQPAPEAPGPCGDPPGRVADGISRASASRV